MYSTLNLVFEHPSARVGPGSNSHEFNQQINVKGKYNLSKFKSSGARIIPKTKRFLNPDNGRPGPEMYVTPDSLNDSGKFQNSNHRGNGRRIISKEARKTFVDPKVLGKGSYLYIQFLGQEPIISIQILASN